MKVVIAIAALIVIALLSTGATRSTMNNRFTSLAASGLWGAALLAALLGSGPVGLIDDRTRALATPLIMLTLGWVGMMIGLQFRRDVLARVPRVVWRLVALDTAVTIALWTPIAVALVWWCFEGERADSLLGATARLSVVVLGWSSATRPVRSPRAREITAGETAIRASGAIASLVAIAIYGISVFGVIGTRRAILEPDNLGNGLAGAAAGLALAILGGSLLGRFGFMLAARSRGDQLVVFLGVITLVAGIAAKMGVSSLFCAAAVGLIIGNSRGFGVREFERFLLRAEIATATFLGLLVGISANPDIGARELTIAGAIVAWRVIAKPLVVRACVGPTGGDPALTIGPIRPHPVALALALGVMIRTNDAVLSRTCMIVLISTIASDGIAWALATWKHRSRHKTPMPAPTPEPAP